MTGDNRSVETVRLIWTKRSYVFRVTVLGALFSAVLAMVLPKTYTSTVQLMPPDQQSASMASFAALAAKTGALGFMGADMLGMASSGALFTGVLRSRTVEDGVIDRNDLMKAYGARTHEAARQILMTRSEVTEDRRTGIIAISVTDGNAQRAAAVAQSHVNELNRVVSDLTTSAAHRERVFLEERLTQVKQDLYRATADLSEFSSKNSTVDVQAQAKAMIESAATLQGTMIAAESEMRGLEQIYTANNVRVRSVKARIDELKNQLRNIGGDSAKGNGTQSELPLGIPSIRQLPFVGARYADLYRTAKIQETIYETLTAQYEMAKVQEAKEIPSVRVLDPANVPQKRTSPNRRLIMVVGTALSFAFSIVWVLGTAFWSEVDDSDARKNLLTEIARTIYFHPWVIRARAAALRIVNPLLRFGRKFRRDRER